MKKSGFHRPRLKSNPTMGGKMDFFRCRNDISPVGKKISSCLSSSLCQGSFLPLAVDCQIYGKDRCEEQDLYADTHPVGVHGECFVGKAGKHIVDADIPIGGEEAGCTYDRVSQVPLGNEDSAQEAHAKTDDIGHHVQGIVIH